MITAYIAAIIINADVCGRNSDSKAVESIANKIKRDAEKLKEYLMEIDDGRTNF